jgi:hypothetical protein
MHQVTKRTEKNPNPQGKGCVAILQDWALLRPERLKRKSAADILRDYCLSALVLAAKFRFRPVPGLPYYLYCDEQDWMLSLIGPGEWGERMPGEFVAGCCLQADATWLLEFGELRPDSLAAMRLQRFVEGFSNALASQESPLDGLPFYAEKLPYYQRLLATGLAVSLQHSICETGAAAVMATLPALAPALARS